MSYSLFQIICWSWATAGVLAFLILQFKNAPYGRFTDKSLGATMDNRLGWVIMEGVALLCFLYFVLAYKTSYSLAEWVMISLFSFHYLNRSFIYPFRTKTKGKQIPVAIVFLGIFHNIVNGFLLGYYFSHFGSYTNSWMGSSPFILGLVIFVTGMVVNWHSDNVLIRLRQPGETGYKIPQKGMFQYVSAANLFGEMIQWSGYAVLTWSLPGFCFAFFTACNLVPRARAVHRWYQHRFDNYPKNRKAVIPYLL